MQGVHVQGSGGGGILFCHPAGSKDGETSYIWKYACD